MEETEDSPSAIEIHNLNPVTSKDLLVCYFESRRGTNVDVIDITFDNVKNMHILWFANEKSKYCIKKANLKLPSSPHICAVVESTLNKTHKLDGKFLDVRQHLESKVLKCVTTFDKMLITGLNKSSTKDSLKNFLEAKLGNTVLIKEILLGVEGAALVTHYEQIRNACSDSTLDGHNISITHVPVSDCVIVSGFNEYTIVDTLQLYFDNKKRCGAEGVKDVKMDRTLGKSAEEVCRRAHVVDGQTLCVLMHYEGFQQRCKSRCTETSKRKWDRNVKAQTMRGNYVFKHLTNTSNNPDYGKEEEAKSDTAFEAQVAVGMFRIPESIII
ncbi:unnamed protein product [Mytilus coruscus]|uniref:RRM domain-containing protein n=1 Tax=Mytilus coruscus TaxID=42192 RepID=A0A6J8D8Q5_MYTCO|nr:unnamed protein product [Mytilus coruscus]